MTRRVFSLNNAWFVTALFTVLSVAATWPLATRFTTEVAWDLGDPVFNCWVLMWTGGQVLRAMRGDWSALADYWNGNIFYPERLTIAYSEHLTPQMLQILPIYAATGNIVLCYNLLFLAALVLSGLGMYLFIREITGQPVAAFVAGAAFAFAPYRVDQYAHLQVMTSYWMPLAFFAFRRYAATGRVRALVGGTAAVVLQTLSCFYYLFFFAPFAAAYALYELIAHGAWRRRRVWVEVGVAAVVGLLLVAPFLVPYTKVRDINGMGVRGIKEVASFSADTYALATASENLTFWGPRLQTFVKAEGNGFPGLTTLALGLLGALAIAIAAAGEARRRISAPAPGWRRAAGALAVVAGVGLVVIWAIVLTTADRVIDLGPLRISLRSGLQPLVLSTLAFVLVILTFPGVRAFLRGVPRSPGGFLIGAWIAAILLAFGPIITVKGQAIGSGPYLWLYQYVPGFNGMRVPARFFMVATVCLAALVGIGMAGIARRRPRLAAVIGAVALVGFLVESGVQPFITSKRLWVEHFELESRDLASASTLGPVYDTVKALPHGTVLAEIPYGSPPFDIKATFFAGYHRKPLINGYSGFFPESYKKRIDALGWDPTENRDAAWRTLLESGATHVVVHEAAYFDGKGDVITAWLRSTGSTELAANGTDRLFAVNRR